MGINVQVKKLSDFSSEESMRFDFKYIISFQSNKEFYSYNELFDFVTCQSINIAQLDSFKYAEIGNVNKLGEVEPIELSFEDRQEEKESLFKKIEKGDIIKPICGDILISKIRPYLNKNVLVGNEDIFFTKAFIHIRPKINSSLLFLLFRTYFFEQLNAVSRQGKGYPTLKEDDLKSLRFSKPIVDSILKLESELVDKISPLLSEIKALKKSKLKAVDIINQIFGEEFGFDWKNLKLLKEEKSINQTF